MQNFIEVSERIPYPIGEKYSIPAKLGTGHLWRFIGDNFTFLHVHFTLTSPYTIHLANHYALVLRDTGISTYELSTVELHQEQAVIFLVNDTFIAYIQHWYNLSPAVTKQLFTLFEDDYSMELKQALDVIMRFLPTADMAENYYKSKAQELMALLVYYAAKRQDPEHDAMTRLHNFITMHFDQSLTLADLAKYAHMSKSKMTQDFKARFGYSIGEYVQELRLKRAQLLLTSSDEPMYAIATKLGFKRQSSFSEWFKLATKESPLQYRNKSCTP